MQNDIHSVIWILGLTMGILKKKTLSWIEEKSEAAVEKWVYACDYLCVLMWAMAVMQFHIKYLVGLWKTTAFFPISSKKQNMARHVGCDYASFSHDHGMKPRMLWK